MKKQYREEKYSALITGANGGIGAVLCDAFQKSGYYVIATDCQQVPQCNCDRYLQIDLTNYLQNQPTRQKLRTTLEEIDKITPLHCLVNNAAVQIIGNIDALTAEDALNTFNVNVLAVFALIQDCVEPLSRNSGSVINISSIHAAVTKPQFSLYAASKAAVSGLTRALAVELGGSIRVNAIEPAAIETPMLRESFADNTQLLSDLRNYHPTKSIGTPNEVADLVLAMASSSMRFMNGACIRLTGGIDSRLHDPLSD